MTRYDKTTRLEAVVRPDQKEWLREQATNMRSISDVLRELIDHAMSSSQRQ